MLFNQSSKEYFCRGCGKKNLLRLFPDAKTCCSSCGERLGLVVDNSLYFLLQPLGHGGYGSVYQACREPDSQRSYGIKIFKKGQIDVNCLQSSLNKEIEALQSLQKVNNVRVPKYIAHSFPTSESEADCVIILEFIDGDNLFQELQRRQAHKTDGNFIIFKEEEIVIFLIDVLETIHIVHTIGKILHRDIKPQKSVRKTSDQKLYLVDFGSSKVLNDHAEYTEVVYQTPAYAPPERSQDVDKEKAGLSKFIDQENLEKHKHTRDLYSLGITIAYLITGKSCNTNRKDPFPNEEWEKWMGDVCEKAPKLGTIVKKMLSFYPSDRYQAALEVLLIVRTIAWKINQQDNKGDEWLLQGWWLKEAKKQFKRTNDFLIASSVQEFLKASQEYERQKIEERIIGLLKSQKPNK